MPVFPRLFKVKGKKLNPLQVSKKIQLPGLALVRKATFVAFKPLPMRFISAFFLAFILLLVNTATAQFSKGMRMPGVTLGGAFFNSGKTEFTPTSPNTSGYISNTNTGGFSLSPSLGWFITNDLIVGGRIIAGYNYDKNIDEQNDVTFRKNIYKTFNAGLGVFLRKYFLTPGSFIPFAQLNISGGSGSSKSDGFFYATGYKETYDGKSSGDLFYSGGIDLGVTKMLNDHIGIDISAGYLYSHNKNKFKITTKRDIDYNGTIDEEGVEENTTTKKNHGFSFGVGLQLFLGGKN
jgi:hypothetical protein